jgi:cell division protein FtsB
MKESPRVIRLRRRRKWIVRSIVFVTCVLAVDAVVGDRGFFAVRRARDAEAQAAARLGDVASENAALRQTIRALTSDPKAIEFVARGELSLLRPDEVLFIVSPSR